MLAESWKTNQPTSEEKWKQFKDTTNEHLNKSKRHCNPIADVVFFYSYPRLDIQVSKQFNHLLKSPFVIHPGTGKVCVPLDPSNWASFDPDDVPTVQELINAVDSWRGDSGAWF
jgi:DNA primase small subunit